MCKLKLSQFRYQLAHANHSAHPYFVFFIADPRQPHRACLQLLHPEVLDQHGAQDVFPDRTIAEFAAPQSRQLLVLCGVMQEESGPDIMPGSTQANAIRLQMIGNLVLRSQNGVRAVADCGPGLADDLLQLLYDVPTHDEVLGVRQLRLDTQQALTLHYFCNARQASCMTWFAHQN